MRSFVKIKPSRNGKITLSFIDIGTSCPSRFFFHITNISFNAIRENKILAKISESTVVCSDRHANERYYRQTDAHALVQENTITVDTITIKLGTSRFRMSRKHYKQKLQISQHHKGEKSEIGVEK